MAAFVKSTDARRFNTPLPISCYALSHAPAYLLCILNDHSRTSSITSSITSQPKFAYKAVIVSVGRLSSLKTLFSEKVLDMPIDYTSYHNIASYSVHGFRCLAIYAFWRG